MPNEEGVSEHRPQEELPEMREARGPRVLLAEDDGDLRAALVEFFAQQGYAVSAVGTGSALLDVLAATARGNAELPDLLITDIWMPGIDVLNIVQGLREAGWDTPVIVISGFADEELRERVDRLGATLFFDKPIDIERLQQAVRRVLAGDSPSI